MEELNDRHEIYNPYRAVCDNCKNDFDSFKFKCKAFPKGIPDIILSGENKHNSPIKGQKNSILFEKE